MGRQGKEEVGDIDQIQSIGLEKGKCPLSSKTGDKDGCSSKYRQDMGVIFKVNPFGL